MTEQQKKEQQQRQQQQQEQQRAEEAAARQQAERLAAEAAAESARRAARAEAIRRYEELNVLRLEPLGMDRRFNRYWLLVPPDWSVSDRQCRTGSAGHPWPEAAAGERTAGGGVRGGSGGGSCGVSALSSVPVAFLTHIGGDGIGH
jgi:hypothetical protein